MDNKESTHEDHNYYRQEAGDSDNTSTDVVGSSPSNSTSSRRHRPVLELIMENPENTNNQQSAGDWIIAPDFYDEDVAENSNNLSEDDDDSWMGDPIGNYFYDEEAHERRIREINGEDMDHEEESEENDHNEHRAEEDEDGDDGNDDHDEDDDDDDDGGFVFAPNEEDDFGGSSTEEDVESGEEDVNQHANYDTTLPVAHHYLGDNLEESRGREVLIEGSIITLPLFNLKDVVFPGQVLPLKTLSLNPRVQMYLRNCVSRGTTTIGLMWSPSENRIGTTAEITSYGQDEEADELKLLLKGRQRFRLISQPFESAIDGQIEILPEILLGKPQSNITREMLRFLPTSELQRKYLITRHPDWVMKKYEAPNLILKIMEEIKDWCNLVDVSKDSVDFSYWLSANLPISNQDRMEALKFSCVEARLVWLLSKLQNSKFFSCLVCNNVICFKEDVFPMSCSGPQCSFVNPNGYIHDTLTVRQASGLIHADRVWSSECSWFPGYVWQVVHCNLCQSHIGWCYKRTDGEMKPKKFFGLSRASVRLRSSENRQEASNNENSDIEFRRFGRVVVMFNLDAGRRRD